MNNAQLVNIVSKIIVAACACLATKYGFSLDGAGIAATVAPIIVGLLATWWAHVMHSDKSADSKSVAGLLVMIAFGAALVFGATGCTFAKITTTQSVTPGLNGSPATTNTVTVERQQIWGGYIVEHSSTLFGGDVESPSGQNNGTVKFKVGFGNDYTRYTPTATNPIYAPKYVTSLGVHQGLASSDINGESASGDTYYTTTNTTAGASVPGTPSQQTK